LIRVKPLTHSQINRDRRHTIVACLCVKLAPFFPGESSMQRSSNVPHMPVWIPTDRTQVPLSHDGAECGRWKLDPAVRFYQRAETACYVLLAPPSSLPLRSRHRSLQRSRVVRLSRQCWGAAALAPPRTGKSRLRHQPRERPFFALLETSSAISGRTRCADNICYRTDEI